MRQQLIFSSLSYLIILWELLFVRKPKFARPIQDLMKDFLMENSCAFGKGEKAKKL